MCVSVCVFYLLMSCPSHQSHGELPARNRGDYTKVTFLLRGRYRLGITSIPTVSDINNLLQSRNFISIIVICIQTVETQFNI